MGCEKMEIKVSDFITAITEEKYKKDTIVAKLEQVEKFGLAESLAPIIEKESEAIKEAQLEQAELMLETTTDPIYIRLETGIINLPFENINRVSNFFNDPEQEVPVNVYLVVVSPALNASGLHIMQICPAKDFAAGQGQEAVLIAVAESLKTIQENNAAKTPAV